MHELSIAAAILDQLTEERKKLGDPHVSKVGLRVGDLAGLDADCLRFGFEALIKDSPWEPLDLEIERVARRQRCPACSQEFEAENWATACPGCGEMATVTVAGDELQIAFIEVDE